METSYDVLVPQPKRMVEVPRSSETDHNRSALVDELCRKHGLVFKARKFRGSTPTRMTVSAAHHGVTSVTFFHFGGRS